MKLILENWRQYLNEGQEGEGMLLYHATPWPAENFIKGIDAGRAAGFGQGAGFYLFTNKDQALKHAHSQNSESAASKEEAGPEGSKYKYLVVVDEPVTPENFDIDYEIFAKGFINFIIRNPESFPPGERTYGVKYTPAREVVSGITGEKMQSPGTMNFRSPSENKRVSVSLEKPDMSLSSAKIVGEVAQLMASENAALFRKFEEETLSKATAVKYNGEKTIYPLQIEDLEGNVIWSDK